MYDLFFSGHAAWFSIPAILGTFFFLIRLGLMTFGILDFDAEADAGGLDGGMDAGSDGLDGADADVDHSDSNDIFKYLSIQSVFAFSMGFGWGALASYKGTGWSMPISIAVGVGCGIAMVYLLTFMLALLYDLRSDGTLQINGAVGLEGSAYAQIPPGESGRGQVTVIINTRQRTYNAVTTDVAMIPRGTQVRITGIRDDSTLEVTSLASEG